MTRGRYVLNIITGLGATALGTTGKMNLTADITTEGIVGLMLITVLVVNNLVALVNEEQTP